MKGPSIRLGADVAEIGHKSLFMVRGFGITHLGNWTAERRKACSGMQTVVGARQYHQCNCIGFLRIGMSHVQTSVGATQHQCNCIGFPRNGMSVTCTVETVVRAGQWTAPVLHWLSFLPRDLWIAESQHIFTPFWVATLMTHSRAAADRRLQIDRKSASNNAAAIALDEQSTIHVLATFR